MILKSCSYFPDSRYSTFHEILEILESLKSDSILLDREEAIQTQILKNDEERDSDTDEFDFANANGSYVPV